MQAGPKLLLLVWSSTLAGGAELYSWHTADTVLASKGRFEATFHQRTRTRHELQFLDQMRVGSVLRWKANPRLTWLAGYYFQPQQLRKDVWTEGHRAFFGVETPLANGPRGSLALRALAERHMNTGRPVYNRYRTSLRWAIGSSNARFRPFVQNELLAVWPGFHSARNSGGVTLRVSAELTMDFSYLYDTRRAFWGGDRQAIVTSVRWTPHFRQR